MAEQVTKVLARQVSFIKILENDKQRCLELSEILPSNVTVVHGDGRKIDILSEENRPTNHL